MPLSNHDNPNNKPPTALNQETDEKTAFKILSKITKILFYFLLSVSLSGSFASTFVSRDFYSFLVHNSSLECIFVRMVQLRCI